MTINKSEMKLRVDTAITGREGIAHVHAVYDEVFSPYAWPGGYTVVFMDRENNVFCANCAKEVYIMEGLELTASTFDEGNPLYCDECNAVMESSYGESDV